jgi:hypothetical protein
LNPNASLQNCDAIDNDSMLNRKLEGLLLHFILIAVIGIAVYSYTFDVPFQFDDHAYLIDHLAVRDFRYFLDISKIEEIDGSPDIKRYLKTKVRCLP